jgi:hypothetical protein
VDTDGNVETAISTTTTKPTTTSVVKKNQAKRRYGKGIIENRIIF